MSDSPKKKKTRKPRTKKSESNTENVKATKAKTKAKAKAKSKPKAKKPKSKDKAKAKPKPKGPPKKRGRKPKGGKILQVTKPSNANTVVKRPNVILHLKCSTQEISTNSSKHSPKFLDIENMQNTTLFNEIKLKENDNIEQKDVWDKIKILRKQLHTNDVCGKRSNCFWCTCGFDNPPIFIPRQERKGVIEVYGCFCSPECAVAYLKKEPIDTSILWERYALLNHIYSGIYNYTKNIKPAPCPYYTLDKYYGNLSIEEYRKLLNNQQLLLIVEKPLTKVLPDLYEENNDTPNIYNDLLTEQNNKSTLRLKRSKKSTTKKSILSTNFNF